MKPANDLHAARTRERQSPAAGLAALLRRLEIMSMTPMFSVQRDHALRQALRPYCGEGAVLPPLPEEAELARLYLYADYFPEDGQLSLTEQVRDLVEVHVPQEERQWLDPLRHSYMDLLEVLAIDSTEQETGLKLKSIGDGREFRVETGGLAVSANPGQVLLTRLIRATDRTVWPGVALILSASNARAIKEATDRWRREREIEAGAFELAEWQEFAKRYAYVLLWKLAEIRLQLLVQLDERVRYRSKDGPFLYALALYEHDAFRSLAVGLKTLQGFAPEETTPDAVTCVCHETLASEARSEVVARLILTHSQLFVECDSEERLNTIKHLLASSFGFALHFQGEAAAVPSHILTAPDVADESVLSPLVEVPLEDEQRLLASFLETAYLEWADRSSPVLKGQTPRHAAAAPSSRPLVRTLIEEMARHDPTVRRTGRRGYDFERLRRQVGLL